MKTIIFSIALVWAMAEPAWLTDFEQAKSLAKQEQKYILLNFSGSDWCAPCIKMKKDLFEQPVFQDYAAQKLVLLQADFPRTKKKQLDPALKAHNEKLADQYNPQGKFPFTLLLDAEGNVLHSWDGYAGSSADEFLTQMQKAIHGK
ncbi:MAG TPA: thioredoxin family protein [Chryseolinea sp.]